MSRALIGRATPRSVALPIPRRVWLGAIGRLTVLSKAGKGPRWNGTVRMVPDALTVPPRRPQPTRYFVNSMSDLFHERLLETDEGRSFIAAVFGVGLGRGRREGAGWGRSQISPQPGEQPREQAWARAYTRVRMTGRRTDVNTACSCQMLTI